MTLNFNGGTHDVIIYKQGERFDRTNLPYFFNSITSVEAQIAQGGLASIKVTLEPSFDDAIRILSSGLLGIGASSEGQVPQKQQGGDSQAGIGGTKSVSSKNIDALTSQAAANGAGSESKADFEQTVAPFLAVRFMYPDQTDNDGSAAETPWYTGVCLEPHIDMSGSNITITMVATATASLLKHIQGASSFGDQPVLKVLKTLAESVNIELTFDPGDDETVSLLNNTMISGIYNEPKLQTIRNILYKLDCYWYFASGEDKEPNSEIRIKSRKSITESQVNFTFVMFRQIDPGNNIIPIYELSLESSGALFLPQGAFGSFQRGVDEGKKEVKTVAVKPEVLDSKQLTGTTASAGTLPMSDKVAGGSTGITNDSDAELTGSSTPFYSRGTSKNNKDDIEAASKRALFGGIAYRLTLPGLPKLNMLGVAQVVIGDFVPGLSSVGWTEAITHTSDSSGWTSVVIFRQTPGVIDRKAAGFRKIEKVVGEPTGNFKNSIDITAVV